MTLAGDMVRTAAALAKERDGGERSAAGAWEEEVLAASHDRIAPLVQQRLKEGPQTPPKGSVKEVQPFSEKL